VHCLLQSAAKNELAGLATIHFLRVLVLYASSLDKLYNYGYDCKDKQNMNDAPSVKREKAQEPSNYKNDGQDVKYISHISSFKMQTFMLVFYLRYLL